MSELQRLTDACGTFPWNTEKNENNPCFSPLFLYNVAMKEKEVEEVVCDRCGATKLAWCECMAEREWSIWKMDERDRLEKESEKKRK